MMLRRLRLACSLLVLSFMSCDNREPVGPSMQPLFRAAEAPSSTNAIAVAHNRIDVFWQDNSSTETGFEIHRSTTGATGAFELRASTGAGATSYGDGALNGSTEYCYKVRAFRTTGKRTSYSEFSRAACATTPASPPPPPSPPLHITTVTSGVDLDADGYIVSVWRPSDCNWQPCYPFVRNVGLPANGSVTLSDLPVAEYRLELTGDAPNCYLTGPGVQTVVNDVERTVRFDLTCEPGVAVAFMANVDGNVDIYTISSTGTGSSTRLTFDPAWDTHPAWSPDHTRIAFVSNRGGINGIFVMNADGSNPMRLTEGADDNPAWSPDGARIAFDRDPDDGTAAIYVINTDGSGITGTNQPGTDPTWSPDGQRIAFANEAIYAMSPDGSGLTALTGPYRGGPGFVNEYDSQPDWSPHGAGLVFARTTCDDYACFDQVFITDGNGSAPQLVSYYGSPTNAPAWSPNGRKIAFVDIDLIIVARADGSGFQQLIAGFSPTWR